jgi:hypothetical protein
VAVNKNLEVFVGGVYDGMIMTDPVADLNGILRAYAVTGMSRDPRRILVIGMATGAWAQVLAHAPGVERVTIVEINPGYLKLVPLYGAVASVLRNPKVEIHIDDGRRWLQRHPAERFDVIVANSSFHYRTHSTNLFSVEYLQLIRAHLNAGGVYYFNTTSSSAVAKTALSVFPYGLRYRNFVAVSDAPLELDWSRCIAALTQWRIDGRPVLDLTQPSDRSWLSALPSREAAGAGPKFDLEPRSSLLWRFREARVITDDNMVTEWEHVAPSLWLPPPRAALPTN